MTTLPAISLHQPYASLIAARLKIHETRSWPAPERLLGQRIAIHAAKRFPDTVEMGPGLRAVCNATFGTRWRELLPRGAFVCTAVLTGQGPTELVTPIGVVDRYADDWTPGRWAWLLTQVERFDVPIPANGRQRWWYVDAAELPTNQQDTP